ncbi:hypothetical protein IV38_GL001196 [Lactobacillus selangorensis]|uniref:Uncharacterized protein n=1 Tax=Lactobacillus selangorensis TaxID=81857 RepID=A0A0R2FU20_9LACO|nr:hypothetical protein [Lactobacillus selangorensis]KRN28983.1 hypothetical protein IV38_GL001196 [Lactobacillus selangorensis]KRN32607.1 hypothetical protein IV40_GL000657 [Lactobacillus selangorensis]
MKHDFSGDQFYYLVVVNPVYWIRTVPLDRHYPFHLLHVRDTFEHGKFVQRQFAAAKTTDLTVQQAQKLQTEKLWQGLDLRWTQTAAEALKKDFRQ